MFSKTRVVIICAVLIAATAISSLLMSPSAPVPLTRKLDTFPRHLGEWDYIDQVTLDEKIVTMLGVDDYIEYIFEGPHNRVIDLYVSFYSSLSEGKQFHSPRNCLVGSGSFIQENTTVSIPVFGKTSRTIPVSLMVLQKGDQKQLVLYWFYCRGRYIHSEYTEKILRVYDAFVKGRTDGAFIRMTTFSQDNDTEAAVKRLIEFASSAIPVIEEYLPD